MVFSRVVLALLLAAFVAAVHRVLTHPLRKVPGPWLARLTRFWELAQVHANRFEYVNIDLHRNYGPVVRLAPNRYSIGVPGALPHIYGLGSKFKKDQWYRPFGHPDDTQANLFSMIDDNRHDTNRKKIASLYSTTSLIGYEPYLDSCTSTLARKLADFASKGESVSIPDWIQYYAFDVIGEITIGEPFGMMKAGGDVEGILETIHTTMMYGSRMSLLVELHHCLVWTLEFLGKPSPVQNIINYVERRLRQHRDTKPDAVRPDFIHKLLDLQRSNRANDFDVFSTVFVNIAAGSDTTGATISAAIYYLARNPQCALKLRNEIASQKLSVPVTFAETQRMPYLQAIVKEVLRLFPAVGMPLSRVVPPEGADIAGYYFPAGTVVGINPWVINRDKNVFGNDADTFRPERWIGSQEDVTALERHVFSFGAGSRTCIGKNLSLILIPKTIAQLYRQFDFKLEAKEWETENNFFITPHFKCRVAIA